MKKLLTPIIIVVLALVCMALLDRSCGNRAELKRLIANAAEARRIDEADAKMRDALEAEQGKVMAEQAEKIASLLANAGKPSPAEKAKDVEIAELKRRMTESEASGDVVQALAEAKQTIAALEVKSTLAEERHKSDLFNLNADWEVKFNALKTISDARLDTIKIRNNRIASLESLSAGYAHTIKINQFWAFVGKYGSPVAFGLGLIFGR